MHMMEAIGRVGAMKIGLRAEGVRWARGARGR
jgi:hypothetical protein